MFDAKFGVEHFEDGPRSSFDKPADVCLTFREDGTLVRRAVRETEAMSKQNGKFNRLKTEGTKAGHHEVTYFDLA